MNLTGVPSVTPVPPLRFSARVEATSSATVAIARSAHGSHPRTPSRDAAAAGACRAAGVSACGRREAVFDLYPRVGDVVQPPPRVFGQTAAKQMFDAIG